MQHTTYNVPTTLIFRPLILIACCDFIFFFFCLYVFAEDVKRLNEKLTETSKVKMELQLKLDDIQSFEVSVQVQFVYQGLAPIKLLFEHVKSHKFCKFCFPPAVTFFN